MLGASSLWFWAQDSAVPRAITAFKRTVLKPEIPGVGSRGTGATGLSTWTCLEVKDMARRCILMGHRLAQWCISMDQVLLHSAPGFLVGGR